MDTCTTVPRCTCGGFKAKANYILYMIQRINNKLMWMLPLIILAAATSGQIGIAKAYWGEGYWGGWNQGAWGGGGGFCGYNCGGWYQQIRGAGYQQGYSESSNSNQYDCSEHGAVFCAGYGEGFAAGQTANNNQGNQQAQEQESSSSSTAYSQSNPTIVIKNIIQSHGEGADQR
jgi:hypothetical protein